jgi:hypothetical protein
VASGILEGDWEMERILSNKSWTILLLDIFCVQVTGDKRLGRGVFESLRLLEKCKGDWATLKAVLGVDLSYSQLLLGVVAVKTDTVDRNLQIW